MKEATRRRVIVLVATLVMMALTGRLGVWQLSRAAQKEALQASLDARTGLPELDVAALAKTPEEAALQHHRHILLRGEWQAAATVFLDNRQMANGHAGFFVVTPLKLVPSGDVVLVQRGWAPRDIRDRTLLPNVPTPAGVVEVHGQVAPPPGRLFEFSAAASGVIRQNLDLAEFSRELGVTLRPLSVLQVDANGAAPDGLLRQWPRPAADVHKHYGYAFQWFALCALLAGLYVWFQLLRPRFRRA
jgi:surfeit locus 1 family protein